LRRNQAGLLVGCLLQARVIGMNGCVGSLFPGNFILQTRYVLLGLGYTRLRSSNFSLQFRDFEHCEGLALMHAVANVHIDVPDIAGDLSMDVDFLKCLEYSGDG
jgi:hypothetical protein